MWGPETLKLVDDFEVHRLWVLLDVLVLENLPVPLHVSAKAGVNVQWRPSARFEAAILPRKYRSHPFWTDGELFLSLYKGWEDVFDFLKQNTRAPIEVKCCAMCGGTAQFKCGKCLVLRYCSKEHQVSHWAKHKKRCKAPSELGSSSSGSGGGSAP